MENLQKIDLKNVLTQFMALYGENAVWYFSYFVVFIFMMWILFLWIRHKGWITTPLEKSLKAQETNIEKNNEMLGVVSNMLSTVIQTQKSNLSDSQIQIIVYDKFVIYKKYILKEIIEIYIRNHIHNKEATINKIKDNLVAILREEDDTFFKLPGVDRVVIPTKLKIKSMEQEGLYFKIYDIMTEEDDEKEVARRCKNLLDNFITINWKMR
jgi:hypothetical protein